MIGYIIHAQHTPNVKAQGCFSISLKILEHFLRGKNKLFSKFQIYRTSIGHDVQKKQCSDEKMKEPTHMEHVAHAKNKND